MNEIELRPIPSNPYGRCAQHGCRNGIAFVSISPITKGQGKGLRQVRSLCREHAAQFAKQHDLELANK